MYFLYNIVISIAGFLLKIIAIFNKKIKLFVEGRKDIFSELRTNFSQSDTIVWFHCASLGEFEQARPVVEKLKKKGTATKNIGHLFFAFRL